MKSIRLFAATTLLSALIAPRVASSQTPAQASDETPQGAQILIDLKDDASDADEKAVEEELGGLHLHLNSFYSTHDKYFIADVNAEDLPGLLERVKNDPRVENAEPNYVFGIPDDEIAEEAAAPPHIDASPEDKGPNDPLWSKQWSFRMVGATEAWKTANGKGAVVAVIDTGVAYENYKSFKKVEDLAEAKFVTGYNFVNDTEHANDDHGHGTHVAGTIAQNTNNKIGVAGLAWGATIMPLKVLDKYGRGMTADIADAIRFAADEGAKVINMSLGGGMRSLVLEQAVAYARKKGVVVVCAAGNGSRGTVEYPAAHPGAFAVSSVGPDGRLAYYSSWGKQLAIAAPGGDKEKGGDDGAILQNTIRPNEVGTTNTYLAFQGTSMATPHVAAAAALLFSAGVTDAGKIEEILKKTAAPAPGEAKAWNDHYGAGILNVAAAVKEAEAETHGPSYLIAGLLGLIGMFVRVGRKAGLKVGVGTLLGVVMGSSGLFFLAPLLSHLPLSGLLTEPIANWDLLAFGPGGFHTAIWASALPLMALTLVLLGSKRWAGFLIGLTVGWAANLLISGFTMPADVVLIPGDASALDRIWLILNALVLAGLASLLMLRKRS